MSLFNIENQGVNTYLVYKIDPSDEIDSLSLGMIENNKIKGVAPIVFTQMNEDKFMKYNISAKVSASQIFSGAVSKKRMLGVLSGIAAAFMAAEEYMIDTSLFLPDLDYIYIDAADCEISMICLPVINRKKEISDLQTFFKNTVFLAKYDQTENCDYVAKLINYLNSTEAFSISDFKKLVDGLNMESAVKPAPTPAASVQIPTQPAAQPVSTKTVSGRDEPARQTASAVYSKPSTAVPRNNIPENEKAHRQAHEKDIKDKINIPQKKAQNSKELNKNASQSAEKMSLLYVLRHYSKENMEIYKAQKNDTAPKKKKEPVSKTKEKPQVAKNKSISGFAVPGHDMQKGIYVGNADDNNAVKAAQNVAVSGSPDNRAIHGSNINVTNANFGETTVLNVKSPVAGETTVLGVSANLPQYPKLRRIRTNEIIEINKPRFRIGKEKSYVDYFISDNTAISRSHADIITNSNECCIVDMNSTNHTYVNGMMIQSGAEVKLERGASVKLANEEFEFMGV